MSAPDLYLLWLAAAVLCGLAFYARAGRVPPRAGGRLQIGLLAAVLGVICARLLYFLARAGYLLPMYGWGHALNLRPEGLAFGGAVLGLLLAGWLGARLHRTRADGVLASLTAPALLMLALARAGEFNVHIGEGPYVEIPALQFFPLAVGNEWGEWYYAVFVLEALCALAVLVWALTRRGLPDGQLWRRALLYLLLTQVLCESLRAESLRWGFVRVHQLFAVLTAAVLLAEDLRRGGERPVLRAVLFLLCAAALIGIEFALDKWMAAPDWALYLTMAAVLLVMARTALPRAKVPPEPAPGTAAG